MRELIRKHGWMAVLRLTLGICAATAVLMGVMFVYTDFVEHKLGAGSFKSSMAMAATAALLTALGQIGKKKP